MVQAFEEEVICFIYESTLNKFFQMPLKIITYRSNQIIKKNLEMMNHFDRVNLIHFLIRNIYKGQHFLISFQEFH
jgi:hypothetical protein